MRLQTISTLLILATVWQSALLQAQQKVAGKKVDEPAALKNARVEVYKVIGDVSLNAYIYYPSGHTSRASRPAIVFFFGGGWRNGNPKQFEKQCEYLASRGMVAMTMDYRVASRHGVKAVDCVADAKSAIRWVRGYSHILGVDPNRIVAAGGSAGGHLAACTGTIDEFDEPYENSAVSSRPNAMVLFNPAAVLAPVNGELPLRDPAGLPERMGVDPIVLSPYHQVKPCAPPTLILHGEGDTTVPIITAKWFTEAMHKAGNRCELAGYADQPHGFFNFGRGDNSNFIATLVRTDEFLTSLGYLQGEPEVEQQFARQAN